MSRLNSGYFVSHPVYEIFVGSGQPGFADGVVSACVAY